jgi:hypothetical protein
LEIVSLADLAETPKIEEWKCFTYTVVPLIGISGPKRVFCMDANFGVWAFCFIALSLVTQSEVWSQGLLVASAVRASLDCKGRVCPTHWAARDMVFHVVSARQIHSRVSGKLQSIQGAYIYIYISMCIYINKYLH